MNKMTTSEALIAAAEAHKAGRFNEADRLYSSILAANPKHPDANHNIGILASNVGKFNKAISFFRTAINLNPKIDQFWISLLELLLKLERIDDALTTIIDSREYLGKNEQIEQLIKKIISPENKPKLLTPPVELLNNLSGIFSSGKFEKLVNEIQSQLRVYPYSADLLNLCGAAYLKLNKDVMAILSFKKAIVVEPQKASSYNNLASVLVKTGDFQNAIAFYEKAIEIKPNYDEAHCNLGNAKQHLHQLTDAIDHYQAAITINPQFARAYYNLGNIYFKKDKFDAAIASYEKAISHKNDYHEAYNNLGNAFVEKGDLRSAIKSYQTAQKIHSNYAEAYANSGVAFKLSQKFDLALKDLNAAIIISPEFLEPKVNICEIYERTNKLEDLSNFLASFSESETCFPDDLILYKAILKLRLGFIDEAQKLIVSIDRQKISTSRLSLYYETAGKIYDQQSKYNEAFQHYSLMNVAIKAEKNFNKFDPDGYFRAKRRSLEILQSAKVRHKSELSKVADAYHFLIGFPRSGTTLLDTMLRTHSKISVLEELPLIEDLKAKYTLNDYNFLTDFPDHATCETARSFYRETLSRLNSEEVPIVVNKMPLNIFELPLIGYLFPTAKFIFAQRHPMDVLLSNWRQNYKLNDAMANMVDLKRIAEMYDLAMKYLMTAQSKLHLNVHTVRYERIVSDPKVELRSLLNFLEVDWEEKILDYRDTALKRRKINTPSYSQVIKPLYLSSCYHWVNYRNELDFYQKYLSEWIDNYR